MQGAPKVREWKEVWRTGISVPHNDGKRSLSSLLLSLFSTEDVSIWFWGEQDTLGTRVEEGVSRRNVSEQEGKYLLGKLDITALGLGY